MSSPQAESPDASTNRAVERTLQLNAPLSAVWKALFDAEELARWFPLEAHVDARVGGEMRLLWAGGVGFVQRIEAIQPERHLRVVGLEMGKLEVATDYHLEGDAGHTTLRVVSSGFGRGADWDELYEGFSNGWDFELRGLTLYLERHRGRDRRVAHVQCRTQELHAVAWSRLVAPGAVTREGAAATLPRGARLTIEAGTGPGLEALVESVQAPRQLVALVPGWNDALFRLEQWGPPESRNVTLWLSTYDIDAQRVATLQSAWSELLPAILRA